MNKNGSNTPLQQAVRHTIIVSFTENVDALHSELEKESLNPIIQRASYTEQELTYSRQTRCFLNHRQAWAKVSETTGFTLICEADFVPCRELGSLPTFWPLDQALSWGYLYQGSPRLLALQDGFLRAQCAPAVAYVIDRDVAKILLRFFDEELSRHSPTEYINFDTHMQWWVMGQGGKAYIPRKHYGEHGGIVNPEHAGRHRRAGRHRADNLAAPLSFLPQYAQGNLFKFWKERLENRILGWLRLFSGRWILEVTEYPLSTFDRFKMNILGLRRLWF